MVDNLSGARHLSPDLLSSLDQRLTCDQMELGQTLKIYAKDPFEGMPGTIELLVIGKPGLRPGKTPRVVYEVVRGDIHLMNYQSEMPVLLKPGDRFENGMSLTVIPSVDYRWTSFDGIMLGRDHVFDYLNGEDISIVAHKVMRIEQFAAREGYIPPDITDFCTLADEIARKHISGR